MQVVQNALDRMLVRDMDTSASNSWRRTIIVAVMLKNLSEAI